jgi:hypothetical protein
MTIRSKFERLLGGLVVAGSVVATGIAVGQEPAEPDGIQSRVAALLQPIPFFQGTEPSATLGAPQAVEEDDDGGPDISEPGPDTADLPDSAFAVPPGVTYFETSLSYISSKGPRVRDYFTNTLIRTGLWEDFELRISTPGVIHQHAPDESTTGFGPLTFGFKQHIWDEVEECNIPAFGIIAQVTAPTASAGFDDGTAIPTVFFNFDYSLPCDSYFEVNFGISGLHADDGDRFVQGSFLWSLGKEWSDNFTTFFHGFFNSPSGSGADEELLMGPGMIWFVSKQVAIDSSYNFGLTDETDHRFIRVGLSIAF